MDSSKAAPIGTALDGTPSALKCTPSAGRSPLRRLNRDEYRNTVRDLLPTVRSILDAEVDAFPLDEEQLGFTNNADALSVSGILAENFLSAAERFAAEATTPTSLGATVGCDPNTDNTCAASFIAEFGRRAYRRPLTAEEEQHYSVLFAEGSQDGVAAGIELVLEGFLESPHFLYRVEKGTLAVAANTAQLNHYEMAARLSYFLWGSMPDAELQLAASASALGNRQAIERQARRMLADPKAKQAVTRFHREWLKLGELTSHAKDPVLFPEYNGEIMNAMYEEASAFVDDTFWGGGTSEQLLTAPYTFVNAPLAAYYGLTPPPTEGYVKTAVDPGQRSGLLTLGALMTTLSYETLSSPIHRGKFVREQLLCQQLNPPPPEIAAKIGRPSFRGDNRSARSHFEQHATDPVCNACHAFMDPIGFGFENFDAAGRWRSQEGAVAVNSAGYVHGTRDVDGPFEGAVELGRKLSASREVRDCVVTQWFRFAVGRAETHVDVANPEAPNDDCTLASLQQSFEASGHDMREILVQIVASDAFRFRAADGGGQ